MSDVLTWKTAVEFVLGENPTPGGGTSPIAQTGDVLSLIFVLLFGLLAVGSIALFAFSRRKASATYGNCSSPKDILKPKLSKIALGALIISILAIICSLVFPAFQRAVASNVSNADETIKAYVDTQAGTVTCDAATIVNNNDNDVYVSSVQVDLTEEAKEVLKETKFRLIIESEDLGKTLYDKDVPGVMDNLETFPFAVNQQVKATLSFEDLDFATAKLLIGKQVLNITFAEKKCWSVKYNCNGAQSGTTPVPQVKKAGVPLILAAKPDFVKDGYTLQDYWTTDPSDGPSATHYDFGGEYTADASITLYAAWKINPVPGKYNVTFTCGEGGVIASGSDFEVDEGVVYNYQDEAISESVHSLSFSADGQETHTITASASEGYKFEKWTINDTPVTVGLISTSTAFVAHFTNVTPKKDIKVIYKIYNTNFVHGYVQSLAPGSEAVTSFEENVEVQQQNFTGAKAVELDKNDDTKFSYFWYHWTIEGVEGKSYDGMELTKDMIAEHFGPITDDVIFIAHFVAPVAKYTETNSTMVFSCEDQPDEYDDFTFPVNNTRWDDRFDGTIDTLGYLTLPKWCNYDGTQKVYPRTVKFLDSFKGYKGLTSTSLWFNTQYLLWNEPVANAIGNITGRVAQERVLTTITGLQNIYTENIEETAMMFNAPISARASEADNFNSIDLSSWNLCPKDEDGNYKEINMHNMFSGCVALENVLLPSEEEGHYFATHANNLSYMFNSCISLKNINLNGDFGKNASTIEGIFASCYNLTNVNISGDFGENAINMSKAFSKCINLLNISFMTSFGKRAIELSYLFEECNRLRSINFGNGSQFGIASKGISNFRCYGMLYNCKCLRSINLTNFALDDVKNDSYGLMLVGTTLLSEFIISEDWKVKMESAGLRLVDESNKWVKNYSTEASQSYITQSIPSESGSGTFSLKSAKAIYNPSQSTFTFVYDCADHSSDIASGCTIFPVNEETGYVTGMIHTYIPNQSAGEFLLGLISDVINIDEDNPSNRDVRPTRPTANEPQGQYYDINNLELPTWYTFDSNLYKIKCLVDKDVTVIFDSSFKNCQDIYSTSCWFMADSDGNAPFTKFKSTGDGKTMDGFVNFPTQNIKSCASMFGGFCYEAYKHQNYWYNRSDADIPLLDAKSIIKDPQNNTVGNVFISSYLDTYNTKLTSLDLSYFNIGNQESCDYGAICANCKALTEVKLPNTLIMQYEEENSFANPTKLAGSYCSFACAFYGCEKLTTITDIESFNPFVALLEINHGVKYSCYAIGRMFYGCKSLTKLNLGQFNIADFVDYNLFSSNSFSTMFAYQDVFCGCEVLNEITLGNKWDLPMSNNFVNIGSHKDLAANLPVYDNANVYWTFTPDCELDPVNNLTTYSVPYNYNDPIETPLYNKGTYVRDASAVSELKKTISIGVDNPDRGSVSETSYSFYDISDHHLFRHDNGLEISCNFNSLWINDTKIIASANEGYTFSYWTLDNEVIDSSNDLIIDYECNIVAHFTHSDWTAKAVYKKNDTKYDGHNTMNFYFDNLDHSSEGEVFPVSTITSCKPENHTAALPSWYTLTYVPQGDLWSSLNTEKNIAEQHKAIIIKGYDMMSYNPFSQLTTNDIQQKASQYSSLWRIQTLVEPEDVIFDKSFKEFSQLRSISMWFMADMFGTQTVRNFYSPTEGNAKNPGFANLFTGNLRDVSYAFGGLFENSGKKPLADKGEKNQAANPELLWASDTQTYGTSVESLDLTGFDFSNIRDMSYMFANCVALKNIKFDSTLDTSNNEFLLGTFCNCENLGPVFSNSVQNWDKFNTDNVAIFDEMFFGCSGIIELDLSHFNTEKAVNNELHDINENMYASGMFSQCTRLSKISITSEYNEDCWFNIKGWGLNLGCCDLADCEFPVVWKLENSSGWKDTSSSSMIPYNSQIIESWNWPTEEQIYSGTFYRSQAFDEKNVAIESNDTSMGTVSEDEYGYINDVQIKLDNLEDNSVYLDNRKITATPTDENSRFAYWKLEVKDGETIVEDLVLPSGYCETFDAEDNLEITVTAVFISNADNAYVAFSNHDNAGEKEGAFTFYYGKGTEEDASKLIPEGDNLIEIFPVPKNSNDYELPSWYRKYQESWVSGDNHPVPKFVNNVETNADTINIKFDESFKEFDELRSMSCWFMGALQVADERVLYNPFVLGTEAEPLDFSNVNTTNVNNVAYMFGGHEFFNEIHGSKNEVVNISNFDKEGNITNLSGLFANLPRLKTLKVDEASFNGMENVTNTSKMFFNTDVLEKGDLSWLKTDEVTNMSYMFARTSDGKPEVEPTGEYTITLPEGFSIVKDLGIDLNLQGMFSGYDNYKKLIVDFSNLSDFSDENMVEAPCDLSYMFQNCYWVESIEFKGDSKVPSAFYNGTNMSYMYQNCQNLKKITNRETNIPECFKSMQYVSDFSHIFEGCVSLEEYSISCDAIRPILSSAFMFADCPALKTVDLSIGYYWNYAYNGPYNMFANSDGSLNTTLEHLKLDVFSIWDSDYWEYLCNFEDMGLSRWTDDKEPIGWIDHETLNLDTSINMPDWDSSWGSIVEKIVQFDRAINVCYIELGDFPSGVYEMGINENYEKGQCLPKWYISEKEIRGYFIGYADGYQLDTYVDEFKDDGYENSQNVFFKLSDENNQSASKTYAVKGWFYRDGQKDDEAWWLQDVDDPTDTKKIDVNEESAINIKERVNIWFPLVPNGESKNLNSTNNSDLVDNNPLDNSNKDVLSLEQDVNTGDGETAFDLLAATDVSVAEVAAVALSAFSMPLPWTFITLFMDILV